MPKWRSVTSSVLQESTLGLLRFKVFFKDPYSGSECILCNSADNKKLNGAVGMPERTGCQDAIQRVLVKLNESMGTS